MSEWPPWQPMDTAPKDGTALLMVRRVHKRNRHWRVLNGVYAFKRTPIVLGWWSDTHWNCNMTGTYQDDDFTHWMPLPPAPATEEGR